MPKRRGLKALMRNETRADRKIRLAVFDGRNDRFEIGGQVLSVAVHLHSNIIAVFQRIHISRLHAPADAEINRQIQVCRASFLQNFPRSVL